MRSLCFLSRRSFRASTFSWRVLKVLDISNRMRPQAKMSTLLVNIVVQRFRCSGLWYRGVPAHKVDSLFGLVSDWLVLVSAFWVGFASPKSPILRRLS